MWLVFAPAAIALLPGQILWRGAIPISGVEGRVLADLMIEFVNFPGAAVISALMVALSLALQATPLLPSLPREERGYRVFCAWSLMLGAASLSQLDGEKKSHRAQTMKLLARTAAVADRAGGRPDGVRGGGVRRPVRRPAARVRAPAARS